MKSLFLGILISAGTIFSSADTLAQTASPTKIAQVNPAFSAIQTEVAPLVQSVSKLLGQKSYQVNSVMEITGDIPGTFIKSQAQINTTVVAPNKFVSEIIFTSPNGLPGKKYQIVSDGNQVWIYSLITNQYSIIDYKQFMQSRDGFMLGTISYFYLKTLNDVGNSQITANAIAKLPPDRLLKYFQRATGVDLQKTVIRNESVEGTNYKVYDLDSPEKGYKLSTYINPQQGDLEIIDLSGQKDGMDLAIKESITNQSVPSSIPRDIFSFAPPNGGEQVVNPIPIQPF